MEAQMADMATHYGWWILAVVLGITELFVGSFYLLVIAVALALAGLSAWLGAVFLMMVDGAARWFTYPVDLPVGIVIALIGGPFFMYLFIKPLRNS